MTHYKHNITNQTPNMNTFIASECCGNNNTTNLPSTNNNIPSNNNNIPLNQHPLLIKYFKMLKYGLSKELVKIKMTQDGINSELINCNPLHPLPSHITLHIKK